MPSSPLFKRFSWTFHIESTLSWISESKRCLVIIVGPIIQNNTYSSGGNGGNGGTGATSHADTSNSSSKPGEPGEQGNNKEITTDPNYINLLNNNAPNNGCVQIIWLYD